MLAESSLFALAPCYLNLICELLRQSYVTDTISSCDEALAPDDAFTDPGDTAALANLLSMLTLAIARDMNPCVGKSTPERRFYTDGASRYHGRQLNEISVSHRRAGLQALGSATSRVQVSMQQTVIDNNSETPTRGTGS